MSDDGLKTASSEVYIRYDSFLLVPWDIEMPSIIGQLTIEGYGTGSFIRLSRGSARRNMMYQFNQSVPSSLMSITMRGRVNKSHE